MAKMSRIDNDANILCLGARLTIANDKKKVEKIVQAFINTEFGAGRHERRVQKIKKLEIEGGN